MDVKDTGCEDIGFRSPLIISSHGLLWEWQLH